MMRLRVLGFSGDTCCLPSPYRIPKRVAGLAFNFSEVEVAQPVSMRMAGEPDRLKSAWNGHSEAAAFLFAMTCYSPAF